MGEGERRCQITRRPSALGQPFRAATSLPRLSSPPALPAPEEVDFLRLVTSRQRRSRRYARRAGLATAASAAVATTATTVAATTIDDDPPVLALLLIRAEPRADDGASLRRLGPARIIVERGCARQRPRSAATRRGTPADARVLSARGV